MKFKRSQLKSIFLNIVFLLIASLIVYALGNGSVILITPANATWTNLTTNTSFTFNWTDVNDVDINIADCKLYMNNSLTGLISSGNVVGQNDTVIANLTTNLYMDKTFGSWDGGVNNTAIYWTIQCTNLSSSPTTGTPFVPNVLYQDLIFPIVKNLTKSFINNSWTNSDIRIEINVTDNGTIEGMFGSLITCEILNGSTVIATGTTGETTRNGTLINVTSSSLSDGLYSDITFRCRDPAGNINTSTTSFNVSLDTTNPIVSFNDPTPADGANLSGNNIIFNFTVDELNIANITVEFDGVNITVDLDPVIMNAPSILPDSTTLNGTTITGSTLIVGNYSYIITVIDSSGKETENSTLDFNITLADVDGGFNATNLSWPAVPNAVKYRIYNSSYNSSPQILSRYSSFFETTSTRFIHSGQAFTGEATPPSVTSAHHLTACNDTVPYTAPITCNITKLDTADKRNYRVRVYVNDSSGNKVISSSRTFSINNQTPYILLPNALPNWTTDRSILNYSFAANTSTPLSCRVFITDRNGNEVYENNGTFTDIGDVNANCTGQINASQIDVEGAFTVDYNYTDAIGRSNQTASSKGGVLTRLFTGWNIITYPDGNKSAIEVCNEISGCSKIALFNNTAGGKSFLTFSNSTLSVNNDTDIPTGEAVYVYVDFNSWVLSNDYLMVDESIESVWNYSLSVPGWNLVGLLHNVSVNTALNVQSMNSTTNPIVLGTNMTYVSTLNTSSSTFYSCKRTLNKCSGTSTTPANINLPKGKGVWMLTRANFTINRSTMVG